MKETGPITAAEYDKSRTAILWCQEQGLITTMECNAQIRELEQRETKHVGSAF